MACHSEYTYLTCNNKTAYLSTPWTSLLPRSKWSKRTQCHCGILFYSPLNVIRFSLHTTNPYVFFYFPGNVNAVETCWDVELKTVQRRALWPYNIFTIGGIYPNNAEKAWSWISLQFYLISKTMNMRSVCNSRYDKKEHYNGGHWTRNQILVYLNSVRSWISIQTK